MSIKADRKKLEALVSLLKTVLAERLKDNPYKRNYEAIEVLENLISALNVYL